MRRRGAAEVVVEVLVAVLLFGRATVEVWGVYGDVAVL
jgi:hypothetical protein